MHSKVVNLFYTSQNPNLVQQRLPVDTADLPSSVFLFLLLDPACCCEGSARCFRFVLAGLTPHGGSP
ncbi:hypothetical protein EYF80_037705 [Liparis tanakae]|uniref:Uncharacterized protein n=1 Tax=Liparis tanakae TaxID=230148 RepID=A0A4Z2GF12_9TELE|nr:hypothetical protein EYF80_037705 [Liparis tanakae]